MNKLKSLILFVFIISVQGIYSQKQLTIGIDYYPNISVEFVKHLKDPQSKFSNSIGVSVSKEINNRLWLASGINFSNIGHNWESGELRFGTQHDGMGGFDPTIPSGEDFDKVAFTYNYAHLEVPIKLIYRLIDKKYKLYLSGGVMVRGHLRYSQTVNKISTTTGSSTESKGESLVDYQKITLGYQAGIGLQRQILKRFNLFMEPRMQLNPIRGKYQGERFKINRYLSYGVGVGMTMDLVK
ncbi:MAG: hypothetical protein DHS20C18_31730 [Saprospiraceae bacterium]|nr:MAG: hypothetical protein DHS20C18_31730 [Saprospiraceae bacterium]